MTFERNVFINCPFDNEYFPILRSILFCLVYLDFTPQISETTDSGANRLSKLKDLIRTSKYSIHDISRVELNSEGLPRFNMPLECGIDFGAKMLGPPKLRTKIFLILEKERHRYQGFISDISGNDIRSHNNDPERAIQNVRDWLKLNERKSLDFSSNIWLVYNEFLYDLTEYAKENHFDPHHINSITFMDLIELMVTWKIGWDERNHEIAR